MISRRLRSWLSGWLVLAVLFVQFATAAYACPDRPGGAAAPQAVAAPCPVSMGEDSIVIDAEQPGLCIKHCQPDTSTFDQGHATALPAPAAVPVLTLLLSSAAEGEAAAWTAQRRIRDRAPPPAHSVLHCCYRI